ncbi:MAG: hypothetical protein PHS02_03425 [Candidatus ainarchaeum sp.]|nr:hypothetical protein [Candidatus ainarchaeum sp.]
MKVNGTHPVTVAEARDILEGREKEGELGYEQKQTQDYAKKFAKYTRKEAEALVEKIMKNKRVTREVAVSLVNVSPKYAETVRTMALKDKIDLSQEEAEEILKLFK